MLTTTRLNLALFLARVPLGAYFAIAGFNKIVGGVGGFVASQMATLPSFVSPEFGRAYLYALPFVELAAGIFVLIGILVRLNALLMALMLLSFVIARKLPVNIAVIHPVEKATPFDVNIVLLGLALCLALLGAGEWGSHRAFRRRRKVLVTTDTGVLGTQQAVVTTTRGTPIV